MSLLRIDVQTAAGVQLGAGPITTATGWKYTNRLDRAGEFSFQMSMADPSYPYVTNRVLVRAWQLIDGTMTQLGVGIVDSIVEDSNASPSTATVSGSNFMRELTWRSVKNLLIAEAGFASPDDVHRLQISDGSPGHPPLGNEDNPNLYLTFSSWFDGNTGTWDTVGDGQYTWYYIGFSRIFTEVAFDLHTVRTAGGNTTRVQYFNGTAWVDLTFAANNFVDGTNGAHNSFEQNGSWTFDAPTDWVSLVQNCRATGDPDNNLNDYWLRFNNYGGTGVVIAEITLGTEVETLTGAQLIMALAPAGWSLTGYTTTLTAVYLQMADETVLDALTELASITGEHFRLSGTGTAREIEWLRTDAADSGIIAMRDGDPSSILNQADRCLISELHTTRDSYDLVTRVRPYGGGSGTARLDLTNTTRIAPGGYTLVSANNFLSNDAAAAIYGQVEKTMVWSNISPATGGEADTVAAANALFDAAYYWLSNNCTVNLTYALTIYALTGTLSPGDTIHIVWLEVVDGVAIRNIDTSLIMLELAHIVDQSGTYSVALTVSNSPFYPPSENDVLAGLTSAIRHVSAFIQPVPIQAIQTQGVAITVKSTSGFFGGINFSNE